MAAYSSHSFVIDFQMFFDVGPKRLSSNAKWPGLRVRGNGTPDITIFMGRIHGFLDAVAGVFWGKSRKSLWVSWGIFDFHSDIFSPNCLYKVVPPSDVCWFINHSWRIDISTINQVVKLEL